MSDAGFQAADDAAEKTTNRDNVDQEHSLAADIVGDLTED